ncbi:MAG: hypothetical protein ACJ741_19790 [Pyrinomonadaceae bacterium]
MKEQSPEARLEGFIDKYAPEVGAVARASLVKLRALVPGGFELVYDNYNALAVGFSPTERTSDAVLSIALYPRWVNLFFLSGARLPDPRGLLKGDGKMVRSITLEDATDLDKPAVRALISHALKRADEPFDTKSPRRLVIKSVSAKQRPRRPAKSSEKRVKLR